MLDAHADRERLGLDVDAAFVQNLEGVAGAVAQGHDHVGRRQIVLPGDMQALKPARAIGADFDVEVLDLVLPAVFAAQALDQRPHLLDHVHQAEGADMRVSLGEDFFRRAGRDELLQHLAAQEARILDLAVELAVREGPRPALAELDVGLRVQLALAPQAPGVLGPLAHDLAAIDDDRLETHLGQDQAGEQAAGTGADHDRARTVETLRRLGHELVVGVGPDADVIVALEALQHRGFVAQGHVDRIDHQDRGLAARVVGAARDREAHQVAVLDPQALDDGGLHRVRRVAERQLQFRNTQHGGRLSQKRADAPSRCASSALRAKPSAQGLIAITVANTSQNYLSPSMLPAPLPA